MSLKCWIARRLLVRPTSTLSENTWHPRWGRRRPFWCWGQTTARSIALFFVPYSSELWMTRIPVDPRCQHQCTRVAPTPGRGQIAGIAAQLWICDKPSSLALARGLRPICLGLRTLLGSPTNDDGCRKVCSCLLPTPRRSSCEQRRRSTVFTTTEDPPEDNYNLTRKTTRVLA